MVCLRKQPPNKAQLLHHRSQKIKVPESPSLESGFPFLEVTMASSAGLEFLIFISGHFLQPE